ncbi:hypothetical protein JD844_026397 [Phrynosoma platyrhinos]|uniref:Broad substrate specificity ATP-binding cassette transporter ABCG2 n=1 Tax=Phrynosoma platyrhinos TaxID=52577 RepID=A0ABQ7SET0_PHRPL|nr:hypothetical protein JD844_026397 [Phrynosoma platyrhinos]
MAHNPQVNITMMESSTNGVPSRKLSTWSTSKATTITFHNICYRVKLKTGFFCCRKIVEKDILRDINGIMRPGLNAILGPTGSGKSSLLDILAARKDPHGLSGDVLINGAPQPSNFKCMSGYVVQDDVVMGTLTVKENLQFSAALRLPKTLRQREKNERIDQILNDLGLTKVADSKVGTQFIRGVSGGERKRTNIGMELITDPAVLFLDEPTTGLDASTANAVLLLLKRMARQGKTIIFSIHQPRYSIFRLFDKLTLLAAGRMLYHGPAQNALDYFKSIGYECEPYNNPTDFFLDVINGDSTAVTSNKIEEIDIDNTDEHMGRDKTLAEKLAEMYASSDYYQETKAELEKLSFSISKGETTCRQITYSTSFCHQLKWVSKRTFKNLLGNPQASIAQLCVTVFLGLVVGAIFFGAKNDASGMQNRVGAMFFMTTNQCFSSISAIELFVVEKKIFIHEYITKTNVLPFSILIGFKPTAAAFFIMMFTLMMVSFTATSMALAIAAGQSVVSVANLLITIAFVFMIYFSIPRYGMTALQINEFVGLDFCGSSGNWTNPNCTGVSTLQMCTGEQYLKSQGIDATPWGLWQNHVALACMTVIFLTIAYLKLVFMKKFS